MAEPLWQVPLRLGLRYRPPANADGFGPCQLVVPCEANADTLVEFNLTIMRAANQGFFEVAVNFEDIFCSAKVDTCYSNGDPIELPFFQIAVYEGSEVLGCDDPATTTVTESCNKRYWNVALGIDPAILPAGHSCSITAFATASDGGFPNADGDVTGALPAGEGYPVIEVEVPIASDGGTPAGLACTRNPLNEEGSGVVTTDTPDRAPIAEIANSTAVFALIKERDGTPRAVSIWDDAVALARRGADRVPRTEIELRAAIAATERGQREVAEALLESTLARTAGVGRIEPTLTAMAAEARSRAHLAVGLVKSARVSAQKAHSVYSSLEASFHVACVELLLGQIARLRGNVDAAGRHIAAATAMALRCGFELAWREADRASVAWAAELGSAAARRYRRVFHVRLGTEVDVLILSGSAAIEAFGRVYELGAPSIPFRLARVLVSAAPRGLSSAALCRRLWREDGVGPRAANRLKVHVHRLRELLDAERSCVLTDRASVRGVTTTSYRWNPCVSARVLSGGARPRGRPG